MSRIRFALGLLGTSGLLVAPAIVVMQDVTMGMLIAAGSVLLLVEAAR